MSLRDELLAPFRGWREAGRDLVAGSRVLARHTGRGLRTALRTVWRASSKGETGGDRADSIGTAVLAGVVIVAVAGTVAGPLMRLLRPYGPLIGGMAPVLWMVAALIAAPRVETHPTPNDHEKPGEQPTDPDPQHATRAIIHAVIAAATTAHAHGYKGIHIAELLDRLRTRGLTQTNNVGLLRDWLEEAGIPVRRTLNIRGKGNTYGIHVDDLTAALGRPLTEALTALEQPPTETPVEAGRQPTPGRHLTPVPDPSPEAAA